jgi:hypothetical protein
MALFARTRVLSPRRRLYEPEAAGFRLRHTGVCLSAQLLNFSEPGVLVLCVDRKNGGKII